MTAARSCILYDTVDHSSKTFNSLGELAKYLGMSSRSVYRSIKDKSLTKKRYKLFYGDLKKATDVLINIYDKGVFVKQVHGIQSAVYFVVLKLPTEELCDKKYRSIYQNVYDCLRHTRGQKMAYGYEFKYAMEEVESEVVNNA